MVWDSRILYHLQMIEVRKEHDLDDGDPCKCLFFEAAHHIDAPMEEMATPTID